jgi:acetate kinase
VAALVPAARRVVVAHLGGGASLCAVLDGRSVWTSMGFTPLDGLVMASRSGSVDPGALLWLARQGEADLDEVLERESGLLGLAGSADMREVLARATAGDPVAAEAADVYVHRLVGLLGTAVALLGGLDVLVFTGGVGENAADVRARVAGAMAWLGVVVRDEGLPADADEADVTAVGAAVRTLVVRSREDLRMAAEVRALP